MLGHTKTHLTEKRAIKSKIKADISAFKNLFLKKADAEDLDFIKEVQEEFESLLDADTDTIPADTAFKEITDKTGKAGALLRGLRVREGLTQAEFAKMINTTQANLSSMESGNRPIGKNKAKLIAEKFDVDYRYFL